jgi:hypothetical protein
MPANKSEICGTFIGGGCREFARQHARINGTGRRRKITADNCGQKPQESPQLRRVQRMGSYAAARRTGCPTMIRKQEKAILTLPTMSPGEYEAAVAAFIRNRGVTRCPTACLVRTQASVSAADRAALEQYEAGREQARRTHLTAAKPLGVLLAQ